MTLTRDVGSKLSIKVGSLVVFLENDRGEVVVKKAELRLVWHFITLMPLRFG